MTEQHKQSKFQAFAVVKQLSTLEKDGYQTEHIRREDEMEVEVLVATLYKEHIPKLPLHETTEETEKMLEMSHLEVAE